MNQNGPPIQSFIVKVWIEEAEGARGVTRWEGHITHVPSGERSYVRSLDDITFFIMQHLAAMGAKFAIAWRIRGVLRRHKLPAQPSG